MAGPTATTSLAGIRTNAPKKVTPRTKDVKKWPILCIGDNILRNVDRHVAMRGEKSVLKSLSSKDVEEVDGRTKSMKR